MGTTLTHEECANGESQRVKDCCHLEGETPIEIRIAYTHHRPVVPQRFTSTGAVDGVARPHGRHPYDYPPERWREWPSDMGKPLGNQAHPVLPNRNVPAFGQVGPDGKPLIAGKQLSVGTGGRHKPAPKSAESLATADGAAEAQEGGDSDGDFDPTDFAVPLDPDEDSDEDEQSSTAGFDFSRGEQLPFHQQHAAVRQQGFFNQVPMVMAPPMREECFFPEVIRRSRGSRPAPVSSSIDTTITKVADPPKPKARNPSNAGSDTRPSSRCGGESGGSSAKSPGSPRSLTAAGGADSLAGLETASTAPSIVT